MKYVVILIIFIVASLASFGLNYTVEQAQVQEKINAKLPFSKSYFSVFTATLNHAEIELVDGKVYLSCDAELDSVSPLSFLNGGKPEQRISLLSGQADMVAIPIYNNDTGEVFLSDIMFTKVHIQGQHKYKDRFKQVIKKLSLAYFKKHPIYTLRKHKVKKQLAKYFLKDIEVKEHELVLALHI